MYKKKRERKLALLKLQREELLEQRITNLERLEVLRGGLELINEEDDPSYIIKDITDWVGYFDTDDIDVLKQDIIDERDELQNDVKRLKLTFDKVSDEIEIKRKLKRK